MEFRFYLLADLLSNFRKICRIHWLFLQPFSKEPISCFLDVLIPVGLFNRSSGHKHLVAQDLLLIGG